MRGSGPAALWGLAPVAGTLIRLLLHGFHLPPRVCALPPLRLPRSPRMLCSSSQPWVPGAGRQRWRRRGPGWSARGAQGFPARSSLGLGGGLWRAGAGEEFGAAWASDRATEGAPAIRRARPHPATLQGTGLFCTWGECVCVSDRVKVCACECPGVRESEPGAARVGGGRICFAAGPSRALAAAPTPAASFQFCTPPLTSPEAGPARRRCVGGFW